MKKLFFVLLVVSPLLHAQVNPAPVHAEVVVYGATPSGVIAAVAAARQGHTVALVAVNNHVGGAVSGGLCDSDMGDRKTVGGYSEEFFERVVKYYTDKYGPTSKQVERCENGVKFEPSIAEKTFNDMINEQVPRITVYLNCRFKSAATDASGHVTTLVTDSLNDHAVHTFTGDIFIDASYEGDLMAGVHVPYRVGREGRDEYNESLAGVGIGPDKGTADKLVMAYNYRLCITSDTANRVLFPKPVDYEPEHWAKVYGPRIKSGKVTRYSDIFWPDVSHKVGPNEKFDDNSDDMDGPSSSYPDADWATRDKIDAEQKDYILSKLYYLQNDPDLPQSFRDDAQTWGFAKDEFTDSDHFPFQLYIREARRMVGAYVLKQDDITQNRYKPDGVCEGSYGTDCHMVRRLTIDGKEVVDHTTHIDVNAYDIPYACLTPKDHPDNLLVPVCLSATHVTYCSIRMEPVYMELGQAAGDAAALALANKIAVQNVDTAQLHAQLLKEGAVLNFGYLPPVKVTVTPEHPKKGDTVHFHAEPGQLQSPIVHYWWDFEGTGEIGAQGADADHAFTLDKTYHASLVVEDQAGRRRIVFADVPVGDDGGPTAGQDVMVNDLDAKAEGRWNPGNPYLPGPEKYSDVFIDAGLFYDMDVRGKKASAHIRFQPNLPRAGRYLICISYRPSPHLTSSAPITITAGGATSVVQVDERTKASPFPFVSLGEFKCNAGTDSSVETNNGNLDGRLAIGAVRWVWLGE